MTGAGARSLEQVGDGALVYLEAFGEGLRPDTPLTVGQWAERYRVLSREASAEPGPYRMERTPFLREICDALSPQSPATGVVFMKSSQVGGSECGFNWIGFVIDRAPGPMLMVQPTIEMAEAVSKQRLAPMFRDTPALRKKIGTGKSRDASNTIREKVFAGGALFLGGANSAASLASRPIKYLFLDEIDRYPQDADGEGCPVELAEKRTATFSRRKVFKNSSPTVKGLSKIETAFNRSSRARYFVPCPHCQHFQVLEWSGIKWDKDERGKPILSTVHYVCRGCGDKIREHAKTDMLERGEWRHEDKTAKTVGFHINALYSPLGWFSWADAVEQFDKAKEDPILLKVFLNTVLGETFEIRSEDTPKWEEAYGKRERYAIGVVPARACLVTAGADVQKDRIEVQLVGWRRRESWIVDQIVIDGETSLPIDDERGPWPKLSRLVASEFPHATAGRIRIRKLAIDSGFNTARVYEWVRSQQSTQVMATKGQDGLWVPISQPKAVDVKSKGRRIARGVKLWSVGVDMLKQDVMSRLKQPAPSKERIAAEGYPSNYLHVPELAEEFFRQLTAEALVITQNKKGQKVYQWRKTYARNEALDCLVYATAALYALGANRWSDEQWEKLAADVGASNVTEEPVDLPKSPASAEDTPKPLPVDPPAPPPAPPAPKPKPKPTPAPSKPKSDFWSGW